jgi:hypothetical protein
MWLMQMNKTLSRVGIRVQEYRIQVKSPPLNPEP